MVRSIHRRLVVALLVCIGCVERAHAGVGCPADLDGDGAVGSPDLASLLGSWGADGGPADLNGDGVVGSGDLASLLGSWGPCPAPPNVYCFWSEGSVRFRLLEESGDEALIEAPIEYAFVPMCMELAPGPYTSGKDIPVELIQSLHEGRIPDFESPDADVDFTMSLMKGMPAGGVVTNVVAGPAGELISGELRLAVWHEFRAGHRLFVGGLSMAQPAHLRALVTGSNPTLTPKIASDPDMPAPTLFNTTTGEVAGVVENENIRPTEPATPSSAHRCLGGGGCTVGCPDRDGVQVSIVNTISKVGPGNDRGTFGAKVRYTFLPASEHCAEFEWKIETAAADNGCGLRDADIHLPSQRRNDKCDVESRRLVLEHTAELSAPGNNPGCNCATVSTLTIRCKRKGEMMQVGPFFTAEIKWERLANGNVKVTVTPVPGNAVPSAEIPLPAGLPCPQ